jgi:hypothetical protein
MGAKLSVETFVQLGAAAGSATPGEVRAGRAAAWLALDAPRYGDQRAGSHGLVDCHGC